MTRARDALAAERRRMPWLAVEKEYAFDGPDGRASLLDLFDGRRQLIVYRAFFEPGVHGWPDHACTGCSMVADQVAHVAHLNARDTTLVVRLARAAGRHRAAEGADGLGDALVHACTDDFDTDFGVDEWHGTNAFIRDGDRVFRTYFINSRGDEAMGSTWSYLDITALGRQEEWEDSPEGYPQTAAVRVVELARRVRRAGRGAGAGDPRVGHGESIPMGGDRSVDLTYSADPHPSPSGYRCAAWLPRPRLPRRSPHRRVVGDRPGVRARVRPAR